MMAALVYLSIAELVIIVTIFMFIRHRHRRIERDLNAAISYALGLRNMFRASIFLRAFHDGDMSLLESDFRDWFDYRDDVYAMEAI